MLQTHSLIRHQDDLSTVSYLGVDSGRRGKIIAENDSILVVKWSAGSHWAGFVRHCVFHSPETHVLKKPAGEEKKYTLLISWVNKRKA